ncbi:hypothetical protein EYF80_032695 [Liparis tanakae]|uniref:Uncharacterized protein n=1 Tax=Liparis tanakae TaxID=230148 RepID=A0A4Z2GV43_9TELE|nr:hypothetical protein EYF80_032695 [Liparis tanakae]
MFLCARRPLLSPCRSFCRALRRALCCLFISFQYSLFLCRLKEPPRSAPTPRASCLISLACGVTGVSPGSDAASPVWSGRRRPGAAEVTAPSFWARLLCKVALALACKTPCFSREARAARCSRFLILQYSLFLAILSSSVRLGSRESVDRLLDTAIFMTQPPRGAAAAAAAETPAAAP